MCACECVCVCVRERERESVCVCVCVSINASEPIFNLKRKLPKKVRPRKDWLILKEFFFSLFVIRKLKFGFFLPLL